PTCGASGATSRRSPSVTSAWRTTMSGKAVRERALGLMKSSCCMIRVIQLKNTGGPVVKWHSVLGDILIHHSCRLANFFADLRLLGGLESLDDGGFGGA